MSYGRYKNGRSSPYYVLTLGTAAGVCSAIRNQPEIAFVKGAPPRGISNLDYTGTDFEHREVQKNSSDGIDLVYKVGGMIGDDEGTTSLENIPVRLK